jgi:EF hand domain-containing protein
MEAGVAKEGDMRLSLIGIEIGLVFSFAVILPAARQAQPQPIQARILDVDAFIQRWDPDHDGTIRDELRKATDNRLRDKLVDKLFHVGDRDGDGRIDKGELNSLARERDDREGKSYVTGDLENNVTSPRTS